MSELIEVSLDNNFWKNSVKYTVDGNKQYQVSSDIIATKGRLYSASFGVFVLDSQEKELARNWRWISNFSATAQYLLEECVLKIVSNLKEIENNDKICLAGGTALNIDSMPISLNYIEKNAI